MALHDICVIGAGPAGLMAAIAIAGTGTDVILVERNPEAGKKLLLTGKGRCNLTHAGVSAEQVMDAFGKNGRFLHSALSRFGVSETMKFFESAGIALQRERGNRVFPASGSAKDVRDRLLEVFLGSGGTLLENSSVLELQKAGGNLIRALLHDGSFIEACSFVVATGGCSYQKTGSAGDGYRWAESLGHTVTPPAPALSPVRLSDAWVRGVAGLSLKNVRLTLYENGRQTASRFGELDFTPFGISGPVGMDLSRSIGEALGRQLEVELQLDLKPALDSPTLDRRLVRELEAAGAADFDAVLKTLLPQKLIPAFARLCSIPLDQKAATLTKGQRLRALRLLKAIPLKPTGLLGFDWSLVTAGGIALDEVDPRSMESKLVKNLYFAGEILDLDASTGGYNLQACWTTGYTAGISAAARLKLYRDS